MSCPQRIELNYQLIEGLIFMVNITKSIGYHLVAINKFIHRI